MVRISPSLLLLLISAEWSFAFAFVVKLSVWTPTPVLPRSKASVELGSNQGRAHSFVEGSSFESQLEEIEAMGGDPFFFTSTNADTDSAQSDATDSSVEDEQLVQSSFLSSSFLNTIHPMDAVSLVEKRYSTDGKGPTPSKQSQDKKTVEELALEWDGTVDEDAHLGLD
jgi:hypothetical protein